SGTLSASNLEAWQNLQAVQDEVVHFTLGSGVVAGVDTAVQMKVYDSANNLVFTITSKDGESVSGNVFLKGGGYTIRFEGGTKDGSALPTLAYNLFVSTVTEPLDPIPVDPTASPSGPAATTQWFFNDNSFYAYLDLMDPYSNPWLGY